MKLSSKTGHLQTKCNPQSQVSKGYTGMKSSKDFDQSQNFSGTERLIWVFYKALLCPSLKAPARSRPEEEAEWKWNGDENSRGNLTSWSSSWCCWIHWCISKQLDLVLCSNFEQPNWQHLSCSSVITLKKSSRWPNTVLSSQASLKCEWRKSYLIVYI